MSQLFRLFIQKIGSGEHTSKNLSRLEAQTAMELMLKGEATPAQIGAFLIAHRIKRPTPEELAGMMDAYHQLGPQFSAVSSQKVVVLGNPYDGRSRTVPVTPLTALILAASGIPVMLHGSGITPTKYGIPLISIWKGLGVDFLELSAQQVEDTLVKTNLTFVYIPKLFPVAQSLMPYRDQIGKRPPLATLELIWSPYLHNNSHIVAGFVHPPTEIRFQETFQYLGQSDYTTIKGLEGSCDLSCSRSAIIGLGNEGVFSRLTLNPRDYGFCSEDVPLENLSQSLEQIQAVLHGKTVLLKDATLYNGGFYLWRFGQCASIEEGFEKTRQILEKGQLLDKLTEIKDYVAHQVRK